MFFLNKNENFHQLQTKFIRTNCMDCLDRTNNVQSFIGIEMLQYQLVSLLSNSNDVGKFREAFRQMWIFNGDCISKNLRWNRGYSRKISHTRSFSVADSGYTKQFSRQYKTRRHFCIACPETMEN